MTYREHSVAGQIGHIPALANTILYETQTHGHDRWMDNEREGSIKGIDHQGALKT